MQRVDYFSYCKYSTKFKKNCLVKQSINISLYESKNEVNLRTIILSTTTTCVELESQFSDHNLTYLRYLVVGIMPPKRNKKSSSDDNDNLTRIAIVNPEKCKPRKCRQECKKSCPTVKMGKLCIEVGPKSKLAYISEPLCIGEFL